jgi:hypothetical protein
MNSESEQISGSRASRACVSAKKVAANRRNSLRSTGPRNTTRTSRNALRHGFRSSGLCEMDSPSQFRTTLRKLRAEFQPAGTIEDFLCHRVALGVIRCHRAGRLEAEFLDASARVPETIENIEAIVLGTMHDGGPEAPVGVEKVRGLADGFMRYEQGHLSMLLRCLRELRDLQRERDRKPPAVVGSFVETAAKTAS